MARAFRVTAVLALALIIAPTVWLRTPVDRDDPETIDLVQVAGAGDIGVPGWRVEGVWHYFTAPSLRFGGFSALMGVGEGRLRAFSDRGFLFTFIEPDREGQLGEERRISGLPYNVDALYPLLWDMESVTRDPAPKGDYWVGYESTHAIHRFSYRTEPEDFRIFDEVTEGWYGNAGLEAMERLSDGRFLILPEGRREALIFEGDPVEGGEPMVLPYVDPVPGFAVTDMAQLPDGRMLLLIRDVNWSNYPPFAVKLAIVDVPKPGAEGPIAPEVLFDFEGVLPPENYEGISVRAKDDGTVAVWIISDDNLAAMQRTLVAKLSFDPATP